MFGFISFSLSSNLLIGVGRSSFEALTLKLVSVRICSRFEGCFKEASCCVEWIHVCQKQDETSSQRTLALVPYYMAFLSIKFDTCKVDHFNSRIFYLVDDSIVGLIFKHTHVLEYRISFKHMSRDLGYTYTIVQRCLILILAASVSCIC